MCTKISRILLTTVIAIFPRWASAQITDTVQIQKTKPYRIETKPLIVSAVLAGYGFMSLGSKDLKQLNQSTRDEINEHSPRHISLDSYTQFSPAAIVYGLDAAGIKSAHSFRQRTIIYVTSQLVCSAVVLPLKHIVGEERPDRSNRLSFPSGHTAIAFSSAQFMYREYRETNIWLALSGYSLAAFTGTYRMLNDKHWLGDVAAGAGFGIASTELAYWLYPKVYKLVKHKSTSDLMLMPTYQNNCFGLCIIKSF